MPPTGRILNAIIMAKVTYALESVELTQTVGEKFDTFFVKISKKILKGTTTSDKREKANRRVRVGRKEALRNLCQQEQAERAHSDRKRKPFQARAHTQGDEWEGGG